MLETSQQGLSVLILTKNEARTIERCLRSVEGADEVIVLDSGSTDDTVARARACGARVIETDWPGFGIQRNRAMDQARGSWLLFLDADEWVSDELWNNIQAVLQSSAHEAYRLRLRSSYCGQWIHYGDWRTDRVLRLFKKNSGRWTTDAVHERFETQAKVGCLPGWLLHESFTDLSDVLETMNRYSDLGVARARARYPRVGLRHAIGHALWTFLRGYVFRLGFLDGRMGFLLACSNAQGCFYRYAKAMLTQAEETLPSNATTD